MKLQSVSTLGMALQSRQSVAENQRQLVTLQQEQSTGKKYDVAGSLGAQTTYLIRLHEEYISSDSYLTNNKTLAGRLEVMQTTLSNVTTSGNDLLAKISAALNGESAKSLAADAARDFITQLEGMLNTSFGGRSLFSGTATDASPLQSLSSVNSATGFSPLQVLQNVIASKPAVVDSVTLNDLLAGPDGIASIFDDTNTNINYHYQTTFYNGNTQAVSAKINNETTVSYDVNVSDPGIRTLLKMAYTLAVVDPSTMPSVQYDAILNNAIQDLTQGLSNLEHTQAILGFTEQKIDRANEAHALTQNVLTSQINMLEMADPYETAVRLNAMTTQLESTFAITSRISHLSIINYL